MNTTAFQVAKKIVANPHGYTEDSVLVAQAFLEAERVPDESGRLLAGVAKVIAEYNKPWKTDKSGGCVGCGQWNPYGHPEQHGHAYDCPEEKEWLYRQDWRARLNELLAAAPRRCHLCDYQHGHKIGCVNNPVDIALRAAVPQPKKEGE